jgi:hypothetical protein
MASYSPYEQGGVTGGIQEQLVKALQGGQAQAPGLQTPETPAPAAPAPEDFTQLGKYANKLGAYNTDKFNNPYDQRSEKYQIGTVMSHFDPNAGITPELIAALNGANIHGAKFSGSGDKLTVDNAGGYDRFGSGGTADVIGGFKDKSKDHGWGAWFVDDQGQPQQKPTGGMNSGMPSFGGSTINNMLQSDAQGNIQQALSSLQQPGLLQQLIAQLQGGQ